MKYETPQLTALTAINTIQSTKQGQKMGQGPLDNSVLNDITSPGYADWE